MPRRRKVQQGKPGVAHALRSDLDGHKVDLNQAPSGGQYGETAARQARMDAVPITPPPSPVPAQAAQAPLVAPPPLDRPTERPLEPITSGLPTGPGPGPSVLGLGFDPVTETLRAAYRAFPNEAVAALLEAAERAGP